MAQTPEGKVKTWFSKKLKDKYGDDCWKYMPPGRAFGKRGTPDYVLCIKGIFVGVEAKADGNSTVSDAQRTQLRKIREAGGIAAILRGKDEERVNAIFREIDKRADRLRRNIEKD